MLPPRHTPHNDDEDEDNIQQQHTTHTTTTMSGADGTPATGFEVVPRTRCPHLKHVKPMPERVAFVGTRCGADGCTETDSTMVCLTCQKVFCSRGAKAHMVDHGEESGHNIVASIEDLSFW